MQGKALPGFRDFYPEDLTLRNHIFATWRSVATRYGFEEYDGPPLESLEMYTRKSGDEIVAQLYTFKDKGDREVALRPEMTPTLARMVAARVQALKKPIRWFSIPQLFRCERVPRNVVEEMLKEAGYGKKESAAVFDVAALRGKDALEAAGEAAEPLSEAVRALEAMGLGDFVSIDMTIVRGLAYYTGIVFELFDAQKALRAIAGGGRYDNLLDLPALGFGMGDVVLGELLKERGVTPKTSTELGAFLIAVGGDDLPVVLQLAHALRERGIAVEYGLRHAAVRQQLVLAAARGAARAVIVGPEERAEGLAVVRDLRTSTEAKVPIRQLLNGYFD